MPPRLSTAELLSSLAYLDPDFDPASLTIPQLTGLLQAHAIDTRPASNKAGLIALFNSEIVANRTRLLERGRREKAKSPRANGIRDGVTGQLVDGAAEEDATPPRARRGSRRSSVEPTASTSRRRTTRATLEPPPEEDSGEPEAEPQYEPPQTRRKSRAADESAFSEENIFQMGSSSPDPPVESSVRRRSRSAQPSTNTPAGPSSARRGGRQSELAEEERVATDSPTNPFTKAVDQATSYAKRTFMTSSDPIEGLPEDTSMVTQTELNDEETEALIPAPISQQQPLLRAATALPLMGLFLLLIILMQFARSSVKLGYCDRECNTNAVLDARMEQLRAGELCLERGGVDCPPIPLFPPFMQPLSCTPCPANATCDIRTLACDPPLILKRHALSPLNSILNGLPGFGPIAFPPACAEDESRKKLLTNAGRWIIERLQRIRGEQVCYAREPRVPTEGTIPWQWAAVRKSEVMQMMGETREGKALGEEKLAEVFEGAMQELQEKTYVLSATDEEGEEWVAAMQAKMGSLCKLRVWARELWMKARIYVIALAAVAMGLLYVRRRLYRSRQITAQAHSMLPSILSVLQRSGVPLLSAHLRDSILSYEPKLKKRQEVWDRVEKIVEMNANVRVGEEEVGGEVGKGWRWIGPPAIEDSRQGTPYGTPDRREMKY